jgi:hypothetical protein
MTTSNFTTEERLNKIMNEMEMMKVENETLRNTVASLKEKNSVEIAHGVDSDTDVHEKDDEKSQLSEEVGTGLLTAPQSVTSLITGMPVLYGIGSVELPLAEEILFEKWYRRTEKSLTGSRVKMFNGT